jgi:ASC-1-like (ASCH) protein
MAKIEDIVYDAININVYNELFKEVTRLKFEDNTRKQLFEIYEEAFDNVKSLGVGVVATDKIYEEKEEEKYGFGDHNICQF